MSLGHKQEKAEMLRVAGHFVSSMMPRWQPDAYAGMRELARVPREAR
jgi:hypothetical protein